MLVGGRVRVAAEVLEPDLCEQVELRGRADAPQPAAVIAHRDRRFSGDLEHRDDATESGQVCAPRRRTIPPMGSDSTALFVAVALRNAPDAEDALAALHHLDGEKDVAIRDAAVVTRTDAGRIELQQTRQVAAAEGLIAGGTVGLIAGLLLGVPVGGALLGLLGGSGLGFRDTGIPDPRLRELGESLEPGHAVVCALVDEAGAARTREVLGRYGEVLEAEVSETEGADP